jgi:hypothetical protein
MGRALAPQMDSLAPDQIGLILHPAAGASLLDVSVYLRKFAQFHAALAAADKAVNGKHGNKYRVAKLQTSSPKAVLIEEPANTQYDLEPPRSGIAAFGRCAAAIVEGDVVTAKAYGDCANRIGKLSSGGGSRKFGYGEVWSQNNNVVRIDQFLERRAAEAIRGEPAIFAHQETPPLKWFRGVVDGSFEGTLQAIDIRGSIPECALVVGPSNQIDCIFNEDHLGKVGSALASKSRVRISGRAIYDGRSGLPDRVEIHDIEEIDQRDVDFLHWRGSFEPFQIEEWEDSYS